VNLTERELHVAMRELQTVVERLGREAHATACEGCKARLSTRRQDVQGILAKLDKANAA
jgi:exonuclease VII small subunit